VRQASFFVIRSPLLEGTRTEPVEDLARTPIVREALERASPSLVAALDGRRRSRVNVWPSITRYVERMRGRSTPFSLMSGYAVGATGGPTTEIRFVPRPMYRRIVRVDVDAIARAVTKRATSAPHATLWVVPRGISRLPDVLRVASRSEDGDQVRLTDVDRSEALDLVLQTADRPVPLSAIVDALVPLAPGGRPEAERFALTLIREHLLVPASTPPVLIDDEIEPLLQLGGEEEGMARNARALRDTPLGEPVRLDPLAALGNPGDEDAGATHLIFDLVKPTEKALLGDDVLAAARLLLRAMPRMTLARAVDPRLEDFSRRFRERYEGREMPLVEAVDPRRGLGFPLTVPPSAGRPDTRIYPSGPSGCTSAPAGTTRRLTSGRAISWSRCAGRSRSPSR
jgi:hypothetical protein